MPISSKSVSVIGMIYKSVEFLDFICHQFDVYCTSNTYKVNHFIIANDASPKILHTIKKRSIPHLIYNDSKPNDYYLDRVYRAWNYGGFAAQSDIIVFVNSDMAFTEGWLDALLSKLTFDNIPCSRLIESGKMKSGQYGISKNFGKTPSEFLKDDFLKYANSIKENKIQRGGLFMPCAFYTKDFIESGGYPEGNVKIENAVVSGDRYFFYSNKIMKSKRHITVFDSLIYHFQEGEFSSQ